MQMRQLTTTPRPGVEKMSCSTAALLTLWHTALLRPHLETMNPGLRASVITRWLLYKFVCNVGGWLGGNDHLKKHDDPASYPAGSWGRVYHQYCTAHAGTERLTNKERVRV